MTSWGEKGYGLRNVQQFDSLAENKVRRFLGANMLGASVAEFEHVHIFEEALSRTEQDRRDG